MGATVLLDKARRWLRALACSPAATLLCWWVLTSTVAAAADRPVTWNCTEEGSPSVVWRSAIGSGGGSLAVAPGRLIVGTNNHMERNLRKWDSFKPEDAYNVIGDRAALLCLDSASGTLMWRMLHPRGDMRVSDMPLYPIVSTPVVEDGRIYYISNRWEAVCLDLDGFRDGQNDGPFRDERAIGLSDADIVWKVDFVTQLGVFPRFVGDAGGTMPSLLVRNERVYCVTGNGSSAALSTPPTVPRPDAPSFVAIDKKSGQIAWKSSLPGAGIRYMQISTPVWIPDGERGHVIFPGGDAKLYAFDPKTGELKWTFDADPQPDGANTWAHLFFAPPLARHGKTIIAGLNVEFERVSGTPGARLIAVKPSDGPRGPQPEIQWRFVGNGTGTLAPVAVQDSLAYLTMLPNLLFAVDLATGQEAWSHVLEEDVAFFSGPIVYGEWLFVPADSMIYVFRTGPKKQFVGRYDLGNGSPHMSLAVGEGRLYAITDHVVWCLRLPGELNQE